MSTWMLIINLAALVGTALIGGLLYAFSVCVMRALAQLPAAEGMRAMQAINRVILNPVFLISFMGTTLLSLCIVLAAVLGWGGPVPSECKLAAGLYLIGTFGLTVFGNVPMNNRLDTLTPENGSEYWKIYLKQWTRLNHIRTAASTLAVIAYGIGFW